jgi:acetoacetyl-CoA synthetase
MSAERSLSCDWGCVVIIIREAREDDFESVYPLLLEFKNPQLTKEHWRQLFIDHTGLQNGHFGWVLVDGDAVVGFVGTILSERTIRGEKVRICNTSSWIVKPEYRSYSLALHAKAIADKSLTVTSLSPSPHVQTLLKMQGFRLMDKSERIILPVMTPQTFMNRCEIVTEADAVQGALKGESSRFFLDHQLPFNHHVLLRSKEGDCYVMMNRTLKTIRGNWRLPFARVHHIGAPDIFVRHLDKLVVRVAASLKVVGMIVDERMLRGAVPCHSFMRPGGERKAAFRSKSLTAEDIDGLYTEAVFVNF